MVKHGNAAKQIQEIIEVKVKSMAGRLFRNRSEAGERLAQALQTYAGGTDVLVLALPRGGVPVGFEVAKALGAPLDVMPVRKLGLPGQEEFAMGALAEGDVVVLQPDVLSQLGVSQERLDEVVRRESIELSRRKTLYRGTRSPPPLQGKVAILVDDGLATGYTMRAAVAAVRKHLPARLVVAVPVGARDSCDTLRREADEVVCLEIPEPFYAVGLWYEDFGQTSDQEVIDLLRQAGPG